MLNVIMLNVIMLNVIMLNVIMLNVIMLNVIMLNTIMLNVIILSVVAPYKTYLSSSRLSESKLERSSEVSFIHRRFFRRQGQSTGALPDDVVRALSRNKRVCRLIAELYPGTNVIKLFTDVIYEFSL